VKKEALKPSGYVRLFIEIARMCPSGQERIED